MDECVLSVIRQISKSPTLDVIGRLHDRDTFDLGQLPDIGVHIVDGDISCGTRRKAGHCCPDRQVDAEPVAMTKDGVLRLRI